MEVVPVAPQTSAPQARERRARAKANFGGKVSSLPDGSVARVLACQHQQHSQDSPEVPETATPAAWRWHGLGELSAGRQALDGAPVAPGTLATLSALTDPEKTAHSQTRVESLSIWMGWSSCCSFAMRDRELQGLRAWHRIHSGARQIPNC